MKTPVAILAFNRPDTTRSVLTAVEAAAPRQLFVFADGPRDGIESDQEKSLAVREMLARPGWSCSVKYLFPEQNRGCGPGIKSALDWIFNQVPECIILEDDCVPDPAFFRFCEAMLDCYRDDPQVVSIAGSNYQQRIRRSRHNHFFQAYADLWGWATWRRAWHEMDFSMERWPELQKAGVLGHTLSSGVEAHYWDRIFSEIYATRHAPHCWGYQWMLTCLSRGLTVYPSTNLISNIGCALGATHTTGRMLCSALPTETLDPFVSASTSIPVVRSMAAERFQFYVRYRNRPYSMRRFFWESLRGYLRPLRAYVARVTGRLLQSKRVTAT